YTFSDSDIHHIESYVTKVKKWKKGLKSYGIYQYNGDIVVKKVGSVDGSLLTLLSNYAALTKKGEGCVYTDNHTREMTIKIGHPVSISREQCDENPNRNCTKGLHVGTQSFVSAGSNFGDTIVACLVNPQHVVSVPYSDAHKMRVCEYYPFAVLTEQELLDFHK